MRRRDRDFAHWVATAMLAYFAAAGIRSAATEDRKGEPGDRVTVEGQVLDPDGRPVPGAKLSIGPIRDETATRMPRCVQRATSDAGGRFTLSISRSEIASPGRVGEPWRSVQIVAEASGFGPAWTDPGDMGSGRPIVLRLARDDVLIEGTVADLEGRPLAGVKVQPLFLAAGIPMGLDTFIEAYRDNPFSQYTIFNDRVLRRLPIAPPSWPSELTTDDQGRFRLTGVGRERLVAMEVQGPTIEKLLIYALARRDVDLKRADHTSENFRMLSEAGANIPIIYGSRFHHLAKPSRPIAGTVSDRVTGRPISEALVAGFIANHETIANARTDGQGRYQLLGLPIEGKLRVAVFPGKGQPFLRQTVDHPLRSSEETPVRIDVKLARGVLIRGRMIDAATRQRVPGTVTYMAYSENPHATKVPQLGTDAPYVETGPDGSFELVGLPGPAVLGGRAIEDRFCASRPEQWDHPTDNLGYYPTTNMGLVTCGWFHRVVKIDPSPDTTELRCDIALETGISIRGSLVDPDGRPVEGASASRLTALGFTDHLAGSSFTATGLETDRPRPVWFLNDKRTLGRMLMLPGPERGPLTVTLQPCGTLVGRLVDTEGRPKPNAGLSAIVTAHKMRMAHQDTKADADGRFHITGLIPGLKYGLSGDVSQGLGEISVRIGEVKDLGDLKK